MNCARVRQILDAFVDVELDPSTQREIETHVDGCAECKRLLADRLALIERLREVPCFEAPVALRSNIARAIGNAAHPSSTNRTQSRASRLQAGFLAAGTAAAGILIGMAISVRLPDGSFTEQAVASHVASLATPRRLTDIASGDRHEVKPWLSGKVDFAPPVLDLQAQGFRLLGARLDHVGDHQAVAVVYRIRNHDINLFVWRAAREGMRTETTMDLVRGFAVASWTENGLSFAAISDVDPRDLRRFADAARQL